jgi:hypothetical protein
LAAARQFKDKARRCAGENEARRLLLGLLQFRMRARPPRRLA